LETTATGIPFRAYVWADGVPVAQINLTAQGDKLTYLHTDHLNTPRVGTDANGAVVWRWEDEAFGATLPNEDPDGDSMTTTVNLRFPGQYYDAETGLHYNWNRYYDPALGRYVTSDPIGIQGGLNTYLYANANPARFVDPLGLISTYECKVSCGTFPGTMLSSCTKNEVWVNIGPCNSVDIKTKRTWLGFFALYNRGYYIIGSYECSDFFTNFPDPAGPIA